MITDLMLTSGSDAGTDLLADLNRLLREGLVAVEWSEEDAVPRFRLTPRGAVVLADVGSTDVPAAGSPASKGVD
jgi:hypothetical protein